MSLITLLSDFCDDIAENFRPEIKIRPDIVKREKEFMEYDDSRIKWLLAHIYLTSGNLKDLEKNPDYEGGSFRFTYYVSNPEGPYRVRPRKVRVFGDIETADKASQPENKLKLALHERGANAGIFYRTYKKGNLWIAEATPAILTSE